MIFRFASRCPHFTVYDAENFIQASQIETVSASALRSFGYDKAAWWLDKNKDAWNYFEKEFPFEKEKIEKNGGKLLQWGEPGFPSKLKTLFHPPGILTYKGDIALLDKPSVAIVGSRRPTDMGRKWVRQAVSEFTQHGISIVSGGARGIDYEAHQSCLDKAGHTIAYLPGGILNPYPSSHDFLFRHILKNEGLLISEFMSFDTVRRENFHQRNRLIAGSADAVIVVEAAQKSGTMITAHKAIAENRELFVVPGSPLLTNYAGSLELICQGANIICSAQELLTRSRKISFEKSLDVP